MEATAKEIELREDTLLQAQKVPGMKTPTIATALLALALTASAALAQADWPREGQVYQKLQADLDRDGRAETIGLKAYDVGESSYFGQLVVTRADGSLLWQGPRPKDLSDPLAFGAWDWGVAGIEVAGDLDGDRKVELLGALPQSDVSPATFRVWRWNGKGFQKAFERSLLESPRNSGRYPWGRAPERIEGLRWIGSFESSARDGSCVAQVYDMTGAMPKLGTASVAADKKGFHVLKWINPPR